MGPRPYPEDSLHAEESGDPTIFPARSAYQDGQILLEFTNTVLGSLSLRALFRPCRMVHTQPPHAYERSYSYMLVGMLSTRICGRGLGLLELKNLRLSFIKALICITTTHILDSPFCNKEIL